MLQFTNFIDQQNNLERPMRTEIHRFQYRQRKLEGFGGGDTILVKKNRKSSSDVTRLDPMPQRVNLDVVGITRKLKNNKLPDIVSVYCLDGNTK